MKTRVYFVMTDDSHDFDLFVEAESVEGAKALWTVWLDNFDAPAGIEPVVYEVPDTTGAPRVLNWHTTYGMKAAA